MIKKYKDRLFILLVLTLSVFIGMNIYSNSIVRATTGNMTLNQIRQESLKYKAPLMEKKYNKDGFYVTVYMYGKDENDYIGFRRKVIPAKGSISFEESRKIINVVNDPLQYEFIKAYEYYNDRWRSHPYHRIETSASNIENKTYGAVSNYRFPVKGINGLNTIENYSVVLFYQTKYRRLSYNYTSGPFVSGFIHDKEKYKIGTNVTLGGLNNSTYIDLDRNGQKYIFDGWSQNKMSYKRADGTNKTPLEIKEMLKDSRYQAVNAIKIRNDSVMNPSGLNYVYARWLPEDKELRFNKLDGPNSSKWENRYFTEGENVNIGDEKTNPLGIRLGNYKGYHFDGWSKNNIAYAHSGGNDKNSRQRYDELSRAKHRKVSWYHLSKNLSRYNLYARWMPDSYRLNFIYNHPRYNDENNLRYQEWLKDKTLKLKKEEDGRTVLEGVLYKERIIPSPPFINKTMGGKINKFPLEENLYNQHIVNDTSGKYRKEDYVLTFEGYKFKNWSINNKLININDFFDPYSYGNYGHGSQLNVYGSWQPLPFNLKVKYINPPSLKDYPDRNLGGVIVDTPIEKAFEKAKEEGIKFPKVGDTEGGFIFDGWYIEKKNKDLKKISLDSKEAELMPAQDLEVTGKWVKRLDINLRNEYDYELEGGLFKLIQEVEQKGENILLPNGQEIKREDYLEKKDIVLNYGEEDGFEIKWTKDTKENNKIYSYLISDRQGKLRFIDEKGISRDLLLLGGSYSLEQVLVPNGFIGLKEDEVLNLHVSYEDNKNKPEDDDMNKYFFEDKDEAYIVNRSKNNIYKTTLEGEKILFLKDAIFKLDNLSYKSDSYGRLINKEKELEVLDDLLLKEIKAPSEYLIREDPISVKNEFFDGAKITIEDKKLLVETGENNVENYSLLYLEENAWIKGLSETNKEENKKVYKLEEAKIYRLVNEQTKNYHLIDMDKKIISIYNIFGEKSHRDKFEIINNNIRVKDDFSTYLLESDLGKNKKTQSLGLTNDKFLSLDGKKLDFKKLGESYDQIRILVDGEAYNIALNTTHKIDYHIYNERVGKILLENINTSKELLTGGHFRLVYAGESDIKPLINEVEYDWTRKEDIYYIDFISKDGKTTIENLTYGTYIVQQIKAPLGYVLNSIEEKVIWEKDEGLVTIVNEKQFIPDTGYTLKINKGLILFIVSIGSLIGYNLYLMKKNGNKKY